MKRCVKPLDPDSYNTLAGMFHPLGKRVCGLYRMEGQRRYGLIGTAVPIRDHGHAALLTAAHVFDEFKNSKLIIAGRNSFLQFPATGVKFARGRSSLSVDVDVAAIALPDEAVAELDAFCEFTGPGEIAGFDEYNKFTLYGFVGCPYTKNRDKPEEEVRWQRPYFYVVREYADLPGSSGKASAVHVAFRAPLKTTSGPQGRIVAAPKPQGISGCGVWKIKIDPEQRSFSRPELVGIGIEYHVKGILVATRVDAGLGVVPDLWQALDDGRSGTITLELKKKNG